MLLTNGDIIRAFYYTRENLKTSAQTSFSFNNKISVKLVTTIMNLWVKASLSPVINKRIAMIIKEQLNKLNFMQSQPKARRHAPAYLKNFKDSSKTYPGCLISSHANVPGYKCSSAQRKDYVLPSI